MTFDLQADGRLMATGTIMPGTAKAFAAEVDKRGGYVKTVVLHSPGGSLGDALAMGRLIREREIRHRGQDGRYCASSCPLVFAGGVERRAGAKAAIGVHQVLTLSRTGSGARRHGGRPARLGAGQKYLREMGVDLGVWIHAMETPNDRAVLFQAAMNWSSSSSRRNPATRIGAAQAKAKS